MGNSWAGPRTIYKKGGERVRPQGISEEAIAHAVIRRPTKSHDFFGMLFNKMNAIASSAYRLHVLVRDKGVVLFPFTLSPSGIRSWARSFINNKTVTLTDVTLALETFVYVDPSDKSIGGVDSSLGKDIPVIEFNWKKEFGSVPALKAAFEKFVSNSRQKQTSRFSSRYVSESLVRRWEGGIFQRKYEAKMNQRIDIAKEFAKASVEVKTIDQLWAESNNGRYSTSTFVSRIVRLDYVPRSRISSCHRARVAILAKGVEEKPWSMDVGYISADIPTPLCKKNFARAMKSALFRAKLWLSGREKKDVLYFKPSDNHLVLPCTAYLEGLVPLTNKEVIQYMAMAAMNVRFGKEEGSNDD